MGADVSVMDPYVEHWWELEKQDSYPHPDYSLMRFFERQENLTSILVEKDLWSSLKGVDAIVLSVRHEQFLNLDPDEVVKAVGKPCAIIDCFTILEDNKIQRYFELGCEVKGLGRGHIQRIKQSVKTISSDY
jgi:UDP-N-acetyl-D-mannosaminuronate dehydrogenase